VAIIAELKNINRVMGFAGQIKHSLGIPTKSIMEFVKVGIPWLDPPPERPPAPPDVETVARVQEVIGMGTQQERKSFDKVMQTWRQVRDGQPRQPAEVERRQEIPIAPETRREEERRG